MVSIIMSIVSKSKALPSELHKTQLKHFAGSVLLFTIFSSSDNKQTLHSSREDFHFLLMYITSGMIKLWAQFAT